ncbi:MAG: hypothetical protein KIT22_07645 [Verrucomicrobiae bacterium]|nr:hypothetical protein [Verrucomicrobiae bacterium]
MKTILGTTLTLLVAYALLIRLTPKTDRVFLQSQWQRNRHVIEHYIQSGKDYDFVFAGSSLTQNIDFDPSATNVYNLALAGDSALTSLGAIHASPHHPRKVFVEINFPERELRDSVIRSVSGILPSLSDIFLVRNIPANFVLTQLNRLRKGPSGEEYNESVFNRMLAREVAKSAEPLDAKLLDQRMRQFRDLIGDLEKRGTTVVLYEMPVHPKVAESVRAQQVRAAFKSLLPDHALIDGRTLMRGREVHTKDGLHLRSQEMEALRPGLRALYGSPGA